VRHAAMVGAALTLVAGLSACGGGSSGDPATPAQTLSAALQLQQQGKLAQAKQLYEQVIAAQPGNVTAQYDLGVIAQQDGDNTGALADYGAALTANPRYVPALYNEATIYTTTDPVLAITTYRQVIALQPVAPTAELNLGLLEIKHQEPKKGVHDLAVAITQDPTLLSRIPAHLRVLVQAVAGGTTTPSSSPTATPTSTPSATTSS
jgi:tetratricopeptide (TPR) repeat protein